MIRRVQGLGLGQCCPGSKVTGGSDLGGTSTVLDVCGPGPPEVPERGERGTVEERRRRRPKRAVPLDGREVVPVRMVKE